MTYNKIKNYNLLLQMDQSRFQNGEVIHCEDEDQLYFFKDGGWSLLSAAAGESGLTMSLYDLNKSIIPQLDPITDFTNIIEQMNKWRKETLNTSYLLYGREISYFTLFLSYNPTEGKSLGEEVVECLCYVGKVYDMYINEDNVWEIWCDYDGEATCLYLFPYDNAIVEFS